MIPAGQASAVSYPLRAFPSRLSVNTTRSTNSVVSPEGVLEVLLKELCQVIDQHTSLQKALILSTATYVERRALVAPHRCLVLHLRRHSRHDIWLRLDRRTTGGGNLLRGFGRTPANDVVILSSVPMLPSNSHFSYKGSFG
jgi:hypothetical protein